VRRIVWLEQYSAADRGVLGGKNASLGELMRAGLPFPGPFAVTATAYTEAIQGAGLAGELAGLVAAADPARPEVEDGNTGMVTVLHGAGLGQAE
jgi:pyruvate,water dikinase